MQCNTPRAERRCGAKLDMDRQRKACRSHAILLFHKGAEEIGPVLLPSRHLRHVYVLQEVMQACVWWAQHAAGAPVLRLAQPAVQQRLSSGDLARMLELIRWAVTACLHSWSWSRSRHRGALQLGRPSNRACTAMLPGISRQIAHGPHLCHGCGLVRVCLPCKGTERAGQLRVQGHAATSSVGTSCLASPICIK